MLASRVARTAFAAFAPCLVLAAGLPGFAGAQAPTAPAPGGAHAPSPAGAAAPSPGTPAPDASAAAAAAAAGASLIDFYTADRSAAPDHDQLELRLRDDGRAWLVTAPAPAASSAPGRFETGTWQAIPTGVTVALDSVASVVGGRPLDAQAERRSLTFAFAPCGLTLVAATPASTDLGPGGIAFAKRHCR